MQRDFPFANRAHGIGEIRNFKKDHGFVGRFLGSPVDLRKVSFVSIDKLGPSYCREIAFLARGVEVQLDSYQVA